MEKIRLSDEYLREWIQGYIAQRPNTGLVAELYDHSPEIYINDLLDRIRRIPKEELVQLIVSSTAIKPRRANYREMLPKMDIECLAQMVFLLDSVNLMEKDAARRIEKSIYYDNETEEANKVTLFSEHVESLDREGLIKIILTFLGDEEVIEDYGKKVYTDAELLDLMRKAEAQIKQQYD